MTNFPFKCVSTRSTDSVKSRSSAQGILVATVSFLGGAFSPSFLVCHICPIGSWVPRKTSMKVLALPRPLPLSDTDLDYTLNHSMFSVSACPALLGRSKQGYISVMWGLDRASSPTGWRILSMYACAHSCGSSYTYGVERGGVGECDIGVHFVVTSFYLDC